MNSEKILKAFQNHIRINETTKTVEIYDDYGVKLVLRNLDEETLHEFKTNYQTF